MTTTTIVLIAVALFLIAVALIAFLMAWALCRAAAGRLVVREDMGEYDER